MNSKENLILRFHQELITQKTSNLIEEGNKSFLWGCKCRSGKTYMFGGVIIKQLKVKNKLNVLIITPAPTETSPQFTNDLFNKFSDFNEINIIEIKKGIDLKKIVLHKNNIIIEDLSLEYLNDSLWKATRFNFDSLVYDEVLDQNLTMGNFIEKMCNYCKKSLNFFGDNDIINQVNHILKNGTEGDQQVKIYEKGGFEKLKLYLIKDVDYFIKE